jgi:hypothetical protein
LLGIGRDERASYQFPALHPDLYDGAQKTTDSGYMSNIDMGRPGIKISICIQVIRLSGRADAGE